MTDEQRAKTLAEEFYGIPYEAFGREENEFVYLFTRELKKVRTKYTEAIQETREYAESRLEDLDDKNSVMASAYLGYIEACDRIEETE